MNNNYFICGHFGFEESKIDGQTIKTRNLKTLLEENGEVRITDTQKFYKKKYLSLIYSIIRNLIWCDDIFILPNQNGLRFLLPIIYFFNLILNRKIKYVVIGGWLPSYIEKKIFLRYLIRNIDKVYVELFQMRKDLKTIGIRNVVVLPNFRMIKKNEQNELNKESPEIKMVFLSRVEKEKGIFTLLEAIKNVKSTRKFCLNVYGPITNCKDELFSKISKLDNVNYLGVADPNDVQELLSQYNLFIFPTYYKGEGFPGVIVESFSAGVPVIASDWKYNSEIIENGVNGLLFKPKDVEDLTEKIEYSLDNNEKIIKMGKYALRHSRKFSFEAANSILFPEHNVT